MIENKSNNTALKEATIMLKELSRDEEVRLLAEAQEKRIKDEVSRLNAAKREGLQEGRQEGIREGIESGILKGTLESAKKMILAGVDTELIKNALDLKDEDMERINRELKRESKK